jgi:hypothetical protein
MTKILLSSAATILSLFLVACGASNSDTTGDGGTTTGPDATTGITSIGSTPLPCDVTAVLQANCQSCHGLKDNSGAPMSLVTWEDLNAPVVPDPDGVAAQAGEQTYQMVETRIHLDSNPMPPNGHARLSAEDTATLDTWIAAGAPKTDAVACTAIPDGGSLIPDAAPPTINCTSNNITLKATSPWTEPANTPDDYVCYGFTATDVADGGINHILAMTPNIDNHNIVHHVLLFEADSAATSGVTSTPAPCNAGGSLAWRIVYGWAPGGGAMTTPPDVGFPYTNTTQFVVQIHYNDVSETHAGETDSSGFSFCTTDQPVKYDADVMAFGSMKFSIPPNGSLAWRCPLTLGSAYDGLNVFAAFPHMHQLGTSIATEQQFASGGGIVDMGINSPWSFNTQIWFPLATTLHQGDVVTTQCDWQNTTGAAVGFGQNTEDEMCYSFTAYYPKTNLATWSEPALSTASDCYAVDAGLPTPDGGWVVQDSGATFIPTDGGTD